MNSAIACEQAGLASTVPGITVLENIETIAVTANRTWVTLRAFANVRINVRPGLMGTSFLMFIECGDLEFCLVQVRQTRVA